MSLVCALNGQCSGICREALAESVRNGRFKNKL